MAFSSCSGVRLRRLMQCETTWGRFLKSWLAIAGKSCPLWAQLPTLTMSCRSARHLSPVQTSIRAEDSSCSSLHPLPTARKTTQMGSVAQSSSASLSSLVLVSLPSERTSSTENSSFLCLPARHCRCACLTTSVKSVGPENSRWLRMLWQAALIAFAPSSAGFSKSPLRGKHCWTLSPVQTLGCLTFAPTEKTEARLLAQQSSTKEESASRASRQRLFPLPEWCGESGWEAFLMLAEKSMATVRLISRPALTNSSKPCSRSSLQLLMASLPAGRLSRSSTSKAGSLCSSLHSSSASARISSLCAFQEQSWILTRERCSWQLGLYQMQNSLHYIILLQGWHSLTYRDSEWLSRVLLSLKKRRCPPNQLHHGLPSSRSPRSCRQMNSLFRSAAAARTANRPPALNPEFSSRTATPPGAVRSSLMLSSACPTAFLGWPSWQTRKMYLWLPAIGAEVLSKVCSRATSSGKTGLKEFLTGALLQIARGSSPYLWALITRTASRTSLQKILLSSSQLTRSLRRVHCRFWRQGILQFQFCRLNQIISIAFNQRFIARQKSSRPCVNCLYPSLGRLPAVIALLLPEFRVQTALVPLSHGFLSGSSRPISSHFYEFWLVILLPLEAASGQMGEGMEKPLFLPRIGGVHQNYFQLLSRQ